MRAGEDLYDLPTDTLHQQARTPLPGHTDDQHHLGKQKAVAISRWRRGFTPTRRTQNQAVGVFQHFSVYHDEVVGQGVDAGSTAPLCRSGIFWCGERYKHSRRTALSPSLDLDSIESQRQTAHQPFFLLKVQSGQLAVILLGNGTCLKDVVTQLTGIVRCVQHQKRRPGTFSRFGSANPATAFSPRYRRWQGQRE